MSKMNELDIFVTEVEHLLIEEPEMPESDAIDVIAEVWDLTDGDKRNIMYILHNGV